MKIIDTVLLQRFFTGLKAKFATAAQGKKADGALPARGGVILDNVHLQGLADETADIIFDRPANQEYEVHMDVLNNTLRVYAYNRAGDYIGPFMIDFNGGGGLVARLADASGHKISFEWTNHGMQVNVDAEKDMAVSRAFADKFGKQIDTTYIPRSGGDMTGYLKFGTTNTGLEWYTASGTRYHLRPWSPSNVFQLTRMTNGGAEEGVLSVYDDSAFFSGGCNYAVADESGSAIKSTYLAGVDHSGNSLRFKNGNGTVLFAETPPFATAAARAASDTFPLASDNAKFVSRSSQKLAIYASTEADYALFLGVTSASRLWTLCPDHDNSLNLGDPNVRWKQIYATAPSISTSDRNRKAEIAALDPATALAFLRALEPVSYKMLDGSSGRTHWGLIAQDVWDAMQQASMSDMDFAGYCRDVAAESIQVIRQVPLKDPEDGDLLGMETVLEDDAVPAISEDGTPKYIYGLRYEEFIPLALLGAQEGLRRAETLEAENEALKDALATLSKEVKALSNKVETARL